MAGLVTVGFSGMEDEITWGADIRYSHGSAQGIEESGSEIKFLRLRRGYK